MFEEGGNVSFPSLSPVWMWLGNLLQGTIFVALSHLAVEALEARGAWEGLSSSPRGAAAGALRSLEDNSRVVLLSGHLVPFSQWSGEQSGVHSIWTSNPVLRWQTAHKDWAVPTAVCDGKADNLLLSELRAPRAWLNVRVFYILYKTLVYLVH